MLFIVFYIFREVILSDSLFISKLSCTHYKKVSNEKKTMCQFLYVYTNMKSNFGILVVGVPVIAAFDGTHRPQCGDRCPGDLPATSETSLPTAGLITDHTQKHPPVLHLQVGPGSAAWGRYMCELYETRACVVIMTVVEKLMMQ